MQSNGECTDKIFAVGDIHGCYRKLASLMERLPLDVEKDTLVFVGDYINRGPESRQVIDYLLDLETRVRNIVFLMGNHEHALLTYARYGETDCLRALRPMGVEATLESYGGDPVRSLLDLSMMPLEHRVFLENLRIYYRCGSYLFTHAGILPGEPIDSCPLDRLLFVRGVFLENREKLDSIVVFGHTPFETPFVTEDKIGIDTGAVYGNMLTAVELPDLRFYHA